MAMRGIARANIAKNMFDAGEKFGERSVNTLMVKNEIAIAFRKSFVILQLFLLKITSPYLCRMIFGGLIEISKNRSPTPR
jgi:hypothetical protein